MSLVPVHPPATAMQTKLEYARELANASLLPKNYLKQPANVLVAIEYGEMLDLHPLTAIAQVHVIDGKPSQSAELMRAQVARAGHRFRTLEMSSEKAVCQIVRADDPDYPTTFTYTLDDARKAGLLDVWWEKKLENGPPWKERWVWPGDEPPAADLTEADLKKAGAPEWVQNRGVAKSSRRDPWFQYPTAMLHARCTSAVVRAACPEVLMGVSYTPEELGAAVNADGDVIDVTEVAPLGRDQQQTVTPEQQLADSEAFAAIKERLARLTADQITELKEVWRKSQFPSLDSGVLTVGQVATINGWLDELLDQDAPDPGPGKGSGPDDPSTSEDGTARDPEHAAEGGGDVDADQGDPSPLPPVETTEAPAAAGPRGAQIDVFKIAERVFAPTTPEGTTKTKHVETMRHRLVAVLTQGRTESTNDLDRIELQALANTMIAIEDGSMRFFERDGKWVCLTVPAGRRPGAEDRSAA